MSKKKIVAIILFIFFSLFIFTFANPGDELTPVGNQGGSDINDNNNDDNNDNNNDNNNNDNDNDNNDNNDDNNNDNNDDNNNDNNDDNNNDNNNNDNNDDNNTIEFTLTNDAELNNEGWAKENFTITVSGLADNMTVKYCVTSEESCTPSIDGTDAIKMELESISSKMCVTVTDGTNEATKCTENFKLDTKAPVFTGVDNHLINIFKEGTDINDIKEKLLTDVLAKDNTEAGENNVSNINSNGITLNTDGVDTTKEGTYPVVYTVEDNAGNQTTATIYVVIKALPEFELNGNVNNELPTNQNVEITIDGLNDNTAKYCVTTEETCTPDMEYTDKIILDEESENIKTCVTVTDKFGISNTKCSETYNIDKTPLVIEFALEGEASNIFNENGWANEAFFITATVVGEDFNQALFCNNTGRCVPKNDMEQTKRVKIFQEGETNKVCVVATDLAGNKTEACSDLYKLDTIAPTMDILNNQTFNINEDVNADVLVSNIADNLTNPSLVITGNVTTIGDEIKLDTTSAGEKTVIYTLTDAAGNKTVTEVKFTVDAPKPTLNFYDLKETINENNWANQETVIRLDITDNSNTGIASVQVCKTYSTEECIYRNYPESHFGNGMINIVFNEENKNHKACAIVTDNAGKVTEACYDKSFGIDTTKPWMVDVKQNQTFTFQEEVWASYIASGMNDNLSNPTLVISGDVIKNEGESTKLNTSEPGDKTAIFTLTDEAGNVSITEVKFTVANPIPELTFTNNANVNENGWARKNFEITINGTNTSDNIKYCLTTEATCTPTIETTSNVIKMNLESDSSKLCATVTNTYGESTTKCTENFKLDKKGPNFSGINALDNMVFATNTSIEEITNALLTGVTVEDNNGSNNKLVVSGIDANGIVLNTKNIDVTTPNTYKVTYKATDMAGNSKTKTINIIIKNNPEFTIQRDIDANNAGWNNTDFNFNIVGTESTDTITYCINSNECTPNTVGTTINITEETALSNVCVTVTTTDGLSTTKCETYKLDKSAPELTTGNLTDNTFEVNSKVYANKFVSGFGSPFEISPITSFTVTGDVYRNEADELVLDTRTPGNNKQVVYTVTDEAGNVKSLPVNYNVVAPTPEFTLTANKTANTWINEHITVTLSDLKSTETAKYCVSVDGTDCTPTIDLTTNTFDLTQDSATLKGCVAVTNGYNTTTKCTENFKLDTVKPIVGEIVLNDVNGLLAQTNKYTEEVITYSCPNVPSFTVKLNGTNCEYKNKYTSRLDYTSPALKEVKENTTDTGWYNVDLYPTASSTDELSGINTNSLNYNVIDFDGDNIIIELTATDNAGNTATTTKTIKRDATAPVINEATITGTLGNNNWYLSDVSINHNSATDTTSGLNNVTIDKLKVTGNTAGEVVTITATDIAGNTATKTYTIKIDQEAPSVLLSLKGDYGISDTTIPGLGNVNIPQLPQIPSIDELQKQCSNLPLVGNLCANLNIAEILKYLNLDFDKVYDNIWYKGNVEVIVDTDDNLSGYDYHTSSTDMIMDYTTSVDGELVTITVYDQAGNKTVETITVKIDKELPLIEGPDTVELLVDTTKKEVSLTDLGIVASDEHSGILFFQGVNLGLNPTKIDLTKPGVHTVTYTAVDKAGNVATKTVTVTVKADAPTISLDFHLKDTTKPLALDNFTLNLGLTDSSDGQLENFTFCMPGQEACQLNLELNSNYIDQLIGSYIPDEYASLIPSISKLYGVAEATNEDICLTVYTGIVGIEIKECVGYNPVADTYNDALEALQELEAKITARIEAEIKKITDARDALFNEINAEIAKIEAQIAEFRNQIKTATDEVKAEIEAEIKALEAEIARIEAEIENTIYGIVNRIDNVVTDVKTDIETIKNTVNTIKTRIENILNNM